MLLGIEIGGTKLQLGVGAGDGSPLVALDRHTVEPAGGAVGILARLESATAALLQRFPIKRIGVGFGGPVDSTVGRIIRSHQIEGWHDFPLCDWFGARSASPPFWETIAMRPAWPRPVSALAAGGGSSST